MSPERLRELLQEVATGQRPVEDVARTLENRVQEDLGYARVDHDRARRCGHPEVIFGSGKTPEQVAGIFCELAESHDRVLATRIDRNQMEAVLSAGVNACHDELARTLTWFRKPDIPRSGEVAVVCAGTSDLPVAREALVTADWMGARTRGFFDVGVAGLHRLLAIEGELHTASAIVVVAGMEGALPSVVSGLVSRPVIAVPTSVGYGASFEGMAALLTMMNSCAAGVSVVNIDNGFGGGYLAALINEQGIKTPSRSPGR